MSEGFARDFKRFFLRGLAAVLPTLLTLMIIIYVFNFVNGYIGKYIHIGVLTLIEVLWDHFAGGQADPASFNRFKVIWTDYFWWIGFILAIIAIYIFGRFVASFIGRWLWRIAERGLLSLPMVKAIYPYIKQVTDFLFSEHKIEFSRVVAVEYPRKGVWSIGLVTGAGMRALQNAAGSALLTVFIPSSPTPVTGYTITVRREEVIDLPMSIDDALRFTISGGVIMPTGQQLSELEIEQARLGVQPVLKRKESAE